MRVVSYWLGANLESTLPQNTFDDESTFVQVMAWCLTAPSHYLSQCWRCHMALIGHNILIKCSVTEDHCAPNPCSSPAECVPDYYVQEGYHCVCPDGYYGDTPTTCKGNYTQGSPSPETVIVFIAFTMDLHSILVDILAFSANRMIYNHKSIVRRRVYTTVSWPQTMVNDSYFRFQFQNSKNAYCHTISRTYKKHKERHSIWDCGAKEWYSFTI